MGSLLILALVAGYLWLIYQITKRVPRWAKPLIIIGAFLAVTADGYLGRKKLEQLCEEQGGLHIYQTVEGVEGFEIDNFPEKYWLEKYGYSFIEGISSTPNKVDRLSIRKNGEIIRKNAVTPDSQYLSKFFPNDKEDGYYSYDSYKIIQKNNQQVIAEYTIIGYRGGWVNRFISSIYASETFSYCSQFSSFDMEYWRESSLKILKPKQDK